MGMRLIVLTVVAARVMFSTIKSYFQWFRTWRCVPIVTWVKAAQLFRQGRYSQASAYYLKGLEKFAHHPASICARLDLAYCLFRLGSYEEAKEHLRSVITSSPKKREGYLRLARIQMWTGQPMEASWTLRRALREVGSDADIVASYLLAVLDNGGPSYLLKEGVAALNKLSAEDRVNPKIEVAAALISIYRGDVKNGRGRLAELAAAPHAPFEAVVNYGEVLLSEDRVAHARQQLRRALSVAADHPRVLSLLAASYLKGGPFYNAEFAQQLAMSACQNTGWQGPREMHVLAEALYHSGDKLTALTIAHKARDAGSKLLGNYRYVRSIERLIDSLSDQSG